MQNITWGSQWLQKKTACDTISWELKLKFPWIWSAIFRVTREASYNFKDLFFFQHENSKLCFSERLEKASVKGLSDGVQPLSFSWPTGRVMITTWSLWMLWGLLCQGLVRLFRAPWPCSSLIKDYSVTQKRLHSWWFISWQSQGETLSYTSHRLITTSLSVLHSSLSFCLVLWLDGLTAIFPY